MLLDKSFEKTGPGARTRRCDHRLLAMVFTELGCHARCRICGTIGPEQPSSEAARQALLILGARRGGGYYR